MYDKELHLSLLVQGELDCITIVGTFMAGFTVARIIVVCHLVCVVNKGYYRVVGEKDRNILVCGLRKFADFFKASKKWLLELRLSFLLSYLISYHNYNLQCTVHRIITQIEILRSPVHQMTASLKLFGVLELIF